MISNITTKDLIHPHIPYSGLYGERSQQSYHILGVVLWMRVCVLEVCVRFRSVMGLYDEGGRLRNKMCSGGAQKSRAANCGMTAPRT